MTPQELQQQEQTLELINSELQDQVWGEGEAMVAVGQYIAKGAIGAPMRNGAGSRLSTVR